MLFADKRNLETNLQVSLLKIREKELQFYVQNCIASAPTAPVRTSARKICRSASGAHAASRRSGHAVRGARGLRVQRDDPG